MTSQEKDATPRETQPPLAPGPIRATYGDLAKATLLVVGLVLLCLVAWALIDVFLLVFAAIVVAMVLRTVAAMIERIAPMPESLGLAIACLIIVGLVAAFVLLLGTQLSGQFSALSQQLPQQIDLLGNRFGVPDLPQRAEEVLERFAGGGGVIQSIAGLTSGVVSASANGLLVLVAAIYLAARPTLYRRGGLMLLPPRTRAAVAQAVDNAGRALRLWLVGQFAAMLIVGFLTGVGLTLLGSPSPLALAFIAGLAEFVPVVGPILAAIPALLLAFPEGGATFLWVLALYVVIQQVESNLIMPLVQRRTVDLPPALTMFSLLAFGVLFGPLGVLLATPLTVVCFVIVKQLYLRDTLKEKVAVPGAPETLNSAPPGTG